ncbi:MAG: Tfp pilus assembly protein FimT/FimU [Phycisphaerales bacterium]
MRMSIASTLNDRARRARGGFTLVELLVVIGVILALVVATLPAFRALSKSNRQTGAMNGVSAALSTARALAAREGRDVAAMFKFDIHRQICSVQFIKLEAVTDDADGSSGGMEAASIFVPIEGQSEIELPAGIAVYGYGYGASRNGASIARHTWYTDVGLLYDSPGRDEPTDPWLLPRNDPHFLSDEDEPDDNDLEMIDTFMVRFSPDGHVVSSAEELRQGLVVNVSGGADDAFLELDYPGSETFDPSEYRNWDPRIATVSGDEVDVPEVHLRSVPLLSIVDLRVMGEELGIARPWMAAGPNLVSDRTRVDANQNGDDDQIEIDNWINENAALVSFNRYTGAMMMDIGR